MLKKWGSLPDPIACAAGSVVGRLADFLRAVHSPWFGVVATHAILLDVTRNLDAHLTGKRKKRRRGRDLNVPHKGARL